MSGADVMIGGSGVDAALLGARQSQLQALGDKRGVHDAAGAKKAAQEFEAMFIAQMLEHMFSGMEPNELTGGGDGEDVYQSFLLDEYGKVITRAGGIGVADHIQRELLKQQEARL